MKCLKALAALATLFVLTSVSALAAPVTYLFTGTASGVLAGNAFSGEALRIALQADTDDITSFFPGGYVVTPTSSSILIGARPEQSFADNTYVFAVQDPNAGFVGFGTDGAGDLIDLEVGALSSFDLTPPFGPVAGTVIASILAQFQDVLLASSDRLTITSLTSATFAAVPAPGTLALASLAALLAAALAGRSARTGRADRTVPTRRERSA